MKNSSGFRTNVFYRLTEQSLNSVLQGSRKEVLIPPPHVFGLMPHEIIDYAIRHARCREVGGKAVPEDVMAAQYRPFATPEEPLERLV